MCVVSLGRCFVDAYNVTLANVDWALINFMRDWFPEESSVKLRQNEKEASEEELREMGIDPDEKCIVM